MDFDDWLYFLMKCTAVTASEAYLTTPADGHQKGERSPSFKVVIGQSFATAGMISFPKVSNGVIV